MPSTWTRDFIFTLVFYHLIMIEIDGSFGEGGGQILRTSLTLSALTNKPFLIYNIRANRPKPGLQRQHLTAVKVVKTLTNAETKGDELNSTKLEFKPRGIVESGDFFFDISTAGSITLIIQTILPLMLNRKIKIRIRGGTDVPKSPSIDYIRFTFLDILRRISITAKVELLRRGHYPEGGGEVVISDVKGDPHEFNLTDPGKLLKIEGISHVSNLPDHIAKRQADSAKKILQKLGVPVNISLDIRTHERSKGTGIFLNAISEKSCLGSDSLGEIGKRAEVVGEEAANQLLEDLETKASVDRHMSDMLMLYAGLFKGEYTGAQLTLHAKTNLEVIKKFLNFRNVELKGEKPFFLKIK